MTAQRSKRDNRVLIRRLGVKRPESILGSRCVTGKHMGLGNASCIKHDGKGIGYQPRSGQHKVRRIWNNKSQGPSPIDTKIPGVEKVVSCDHLILHACDDRRRTETLSNLLEGCLARYNERHILIPNGFVDGNACPTYKPATRHGQRDYTESEKGPQETLLAGSPNHRTATIEIGAGRCVYRTRRRRRFPPD